MSEQVRNSEIKIEISLLSPHPQFLPLNHQDDHNDQGDFKTGLHLILCYYATGDKDRMKKGFSQLVEIPLEVNLGENFDAMTQ